MSRLETMKVNKVQEKDLKYVGSSLLSRLDVQYLFSRSSNVLEMCI